VLIAGGMVASMRWTPNRMVSRITVPVLLLAGRYDYIFPVETSQVPFMDLLGTPKKDKRHVVFEAGHLPLPRSELIRETLEWLDRYQGPVVR
jgi:eukaryotic-like serine/threonine-protein kinase